MVICFGQIGKLTELVKENITIKHHNTCTQKLLCISLFSDCGVRGKGGKLDSHI